MQRGPMDSPVQVLASTPANGSKLEEFPAAKLGLQVIG